VDDLKARQDLYNGFGDTLAKGFELAVTPVLFGGIGYLLDRYFGLTPVLTLVLFVLSVVGLGVRMYYGYVAEMEAHESNAPWARRPDVDAPRRRGASGSDDTP
jgi:F0F1-type ATP synthase assembly protein I